MQKKNEQKIYPCCPQCLIYCTLEFVNQKIRLFCDNCSYCKTFKVDNNLISNIFKKFAPQKIEYSSDVLCDKCKKLYCTKCYTKHKDILVNCEFQQKEQNNIKSIYIIEKKKYSNYNIKCDKCKRKYTLDIINPHINQKKSLWKIKKNLQEAENYLKSYYCILKLNIDLELKEKNVLIEKSFSYNYNYHTILFELIHSLINIYENNKNSIIYESIVNLTHFTYPTLDFPLEIELNKKILQLHNFFSTKFMFIEKNLEQNFLSQKYIMKETIYYDDKVVICKDKLIIYGDDEITIYTLFDFQFVARVKLNELVTDVEFDIFDVCVLNEKELLISSRSLLFICTFNGYNDKATLIKSYHRSIIEKIYINQNKQIITCSDDKIVIRNSFHPYDFIKEIKFKLEMMNFYLLKNNRMVIIEDLISDDSSIGVLDLQTKKIIKTSCKYQFNPNCLFKEISDQKVAISSVGFIYIYNHFTNQIESIIKGGIEERYLNYFLIKGFIFTHYNNSIVFYDEITFQKIFELKQPKHNLHYLISLSNGSVLGLYEELLNESDKQKQDEPKTFE